MWLTLRRMSFRWGLQRWATRIRLKVHRRCAGYGPSSCRCNCQILALQWPHLCLLLAFHLGWSSQKDPCNSTGPCQERQPASARWLSLKRAGGDQSGRGDLKGSWTVRVH
jgi:hypothetical protein